jgi:hypothetical protein
LPQDFAMTASLPSALDNSHYEQACDQAIAMCDGNTRSTIKALLMANEYLEMELLELQVAMSTGCVPKRLTKEISTEDISTEDLLQPLSNAAGNAA